MWDDQFEEILRDSLPFYPADQPLTADLDLQDYGLDSFGIIELLTSLEAGYGVRFRDDAMTRATFATPASLWGVVSALADAA